MASRSCCSIVGESCASVNASLSRAVRRVLRKAAVRGVGTRCIATTFAGLAAMSASPLCPPALAALAVRGGDGSAGFVLKGIDADDSSGSSVSGAGDVNGDGIDDVIIGAQYADPGGQLQAGESYVVFGRVTGFPAAFELSSLLPRAGGDGSKGFLLKGIDAVDHSGRSVSGAGDVNGDGIDDVIIGAHYADPNGQSERGESYVVFGRATGFPAALRLSSLLPAGGGDGSAGFVLRGIDAFDDSGQPVSNAGDVNGDGIDDLIIGAKWASPHGRSNAGESYVVFGRTTGFPAALPLASLLPGGGGDGSAGFVLKGIDASDFSASSVSGAGDVNGDGIDDLIIGASSADANGRPYTGESYVVFGRATGFPAAFELRSLLPGAGGDGSEGFVLKGIDRDGQSGWSVSGAGDVNGDGIDDLIIGARFADRNGQFGAGESYVVFGRATAFPAVLQLWSLLHGLGGDGSAGFVLRAIDGYDYSGSSVSSAGDVNGDGIDDVIIGAPSADPNGRSSAGESYVVFGRATGFPPALPLGSLLPGGGGDGSAGFVLRGINAFDDSGSSVSSAGDVNDDGIDDLIIGAHSADPNGQSNAGETYVVFGRTTGFPAAFELSSLLPP